MNRTAAERSASRPYIKIDVITSSLLIGLTLPLQVHAQTPTPDPAAWRPMSYADLQRPNPTTSTYADIWKDAIDRNNRAYAERAGIIGLTMEMHR